MQQMTIAPAIRRALNVLLCCCLCWSGITVAQISTERVHLAIRAQSLSSALTQFGRETGTEIVFRPQTVNKKISTAINGDFTREAAIASLLGGTGLTYRITAQGAIVVDVSSTLDKHPEHTSVSGASAPEDQSAPSDSPPQSSGPTAAKSAKKEPALEEVVVTGTNIQGVKDETLPISTYTRTDLDQSGVSTTQDFFRQLPQNFTGGANGLSEDGYAGGGSLAYLNSGHASAINLLGLGASSTLVLVNGHRMAPSDFGTAVDVSLIPFAAIDRIDVVTDGSSAIYGSDAVAGVVNIILKQNYNGADTTARYGAADGDTHKDKLLSQTAGKSWSTGNLLATIQYQGDTALRAQDRAATRGAEEPSDIFPGYTSYAGTLNFSQQIGDRLNMHADGLFSTKSLKTPFTFAAETLVDNSRSSNLNLNADASYQMGDGWSAKTGLTYSRQETHQDTTEFGAGGPGFVYLKLPFTTLQVDTVVNGRLGTIPAGTISVAGGASYRSDDFQAYGSETNVPVMNITKRTVKAVFAQVYSPLIGDSMNVPLVRQLDISAAVRYDHYSDFGGTTNPRLGVHWAPTKGFDFRASYDTSFRAPDGYELQTASFPNSLLAYALPSPNGLNLSPTLIEEGSERNIGPERSRAFSLGPRYKPEFAPGLDLSLNYYSIVYKNRIVTPPFNFNALSTPSIYGVDLSAVPSQAAAQAIIDNVIAQGGQFSDLIGNGAAGIQYLLNLEQQNAALLRQSGLQGNVGYGHDLAGGRLLLNLNAAYINHINVALAPGAATMNQVNTFGQPVKLRLRNSAGWSNAIGDLIAAVNFTGGYINNEAVGNPHIDSWTTIDLQARLNLESLSPSLALSGCALTLGVQNLLNKDPPFAMNALTGVNYDAANANPLGRVMSLQLDKRW
jgi:iron complex outermembrane recepter protein